MSYSAALLLAASILVPRPGFAADSTDTKPASHEQTPLPARTFTERLVVTAEPRPARPASTTRKGTVGRGLVKGATALLVAMVNEQQ